MEGIDTTKIACIGAGYVGGPTMAVIAKCCPHLTVHVLDKDPTKIDRWNSERLPIYEPGLHEIVMQVRGKNLFFSTEVDRYIAECDILFVCVSTPTKNFGMGKGFAANVCYVEEAARFISRSASSNKIIVEKSTVPVRTADALGRVFNANKKEGVQFHLLSNPEFLAEGTAIQDLLHMERVLIGGTNQEAMEVLAAIYACWVPRERILLSDIWSAELSKLVSNAFLAQRISSINTISAICEKTGADVTRVSRAVGMDSRIGARYLHASVGFGGSCLRKDVQSLCYIARTYNLNEVADYWQAVVDINSWQKRRFSKTIVDSMFNTVEGKKLAILGFAFKSNTGDTRDTPAVDVCGNLLSERAILTFYDPNVTLPAARAAFQGEIAIGVDFEKSFSRANSVEEACVGAHGVVVLTEWDGYNKADWQSVYDQMMKPAFVFDGCNVLNHARLRTLGFEVSGVGTAQLSR